MKFGSFELRLGFLVFILYFIVSLLQAVPSPPYYNFSRFFTYIPLLIVLIITIYGFLKSKPWVPKAFLFGGMAAFAIIYLAMIVPQLVSSSEIAIGSAVSSWLLLMSIAIPSDAIVVGAFSAYFFALEEFKPKKGK